MNCCIKSYVAICVSGFNGYEFIIIVIKYYMYTIRLIKYAYIYISYILLKKTIKLINTLFLYIVDYITANNHMEKFAKFTLIERMSEQGYNYFILLYNNIKALSVFTADRALIIL